MAIAFSAARSRDRALALYNTLTKEQKDQIPQQLRVWRELPQRKILWRTPNATQVETKVEIVLLQSSRLDIRPRIKPDFEVAIAIQQGELGTVGSAV